MDNFVPIEFSLNELPGVVATVLREANQTRCFVFDAPMGAGKTTFIRSLCHELGVIDTVNSPTFAIINHYQTTQHQNVYHMDWYRLRNSADAIESGVEDCLYEPHAYNFIEWPERAEELLPKPYLRLQLQVVTEHTRRLIRTWVL